MATATPTKTLILDQQQIRQKVARIAYEILENNHKEKEIILAGIHGTGFRFAEYLQQQLQEFSDIRFELVKIQMNKKEPLKALIHSEPDADPNDKTIIIVDDVANTGKTLFYALKPLLNYQPRKIQIAVLVDREHKTFPVATDYVGLSLSTTMQEHITVHLDGKVKDAVYLS